MKYIYCLVFVVCLSLATHAQSIKTEDGRRVAAIDEKISAVQSKIDEAQKKIDELLVRYTPEYKEIVAIKAVIADLQQAVLKLETEKKVLATKELVRKLPNTDVELLKVIVLQNERIITLLEELVKHPSN